METTLHMKVNAFLALLTTVLALVAVNTNNWMSFGMVHVGLFRTCFGSICIIHMEYITSQGIHYLVVILIGGGLGCIFMVASTVLLLIDLQKKQKSLIKTGTILLVLGEVLYAGMTVLYLILALDKLEYLGWSFYIAAAATGLGFINFISVLNHCCGRPSEMVEIEPAVV